MFDYLTATELAEMLGVSVDSIYRWSDAGVFPKPIKLTKSCHRWNRSTVEKFLAKLEERIENKEIIL